MGNKTFKIHNKTSSNNLLFFILIFYYLCATIMPFVSQISGGLFYMSIVMLLYFLIFFNNHDSLNRYIIFIIPFLPIVLLNLTSIFLSGQANPLVFIYQQLVILIPSIICFYLLIGNKRKSIKWILCVSLIAFLVTAITSYFGLKDNPFAARFLATVSDSKDINAVSFNMKNIGGYTTVYSVVLIFPMIICMYKQKKISPFFMLPITIVIGLYILSTQYATALMLFILSLTLFAFPKHIGRKKIVIICIIVVISLVILKPLLIILLNFIGSSVKSDTLSERFNYLAQTLNGVQNTSDVGARRDVLMLSLNSFVKNPLLGGVFLNSYSVGGHSYILDNFVKYGLLGVASLFLMYIQIFKKLYYPFINTEYYGYMILSLMQALVLSTINTGNFLFVIAFVIPLIGYVLQNKNYKSTKGGAILFENSLDN